MPLLEIEDYKPHCFRSNMDKAIHSLAGLLNGIALDGVITSSEFKELKSWVDNQYVFKFRQPFSEIIAMLEAALEDNVFSIEEKNDLLWACNNMITDNEYYSQWTADIQHLHGMLHGILADGIITEAELKGLDRWIMDHQYLKRTYPFDEVESIITQVMSDGKIDPSEHEILKNFFSYFCHLSNVGNKSTQLPMHINGVCALDPVVSFNNTIFCFSGKSSRLSRNSFAKLISDKGCEYKDTISKMINYLVVGAESNPCWAFSCYGRKIERAMEFRALGCPIQIIHEVDFWDALED